MSITGNLTDFSLSEIFQLLAQGHKTGLLTLRSLPESQTRLLGNSCIWVNQGYVVATSNQSNQQGLVNLIAQYPWVSDRVVTKLAQFCPSHTPLGLYLRQQGVLQLEQLEHLFQVQIAQQLCALFQLKDAWFSFEQNGFIPNQEMTGLSLSASLLEVVLQKLVLLQKICEARKWQQKQSGLGDYSEFCPQVITSLDIAFFHSLKFSLFDTNTTLEKLSQLLDLSNCPYDLPKSKLHQAMCCTNH